MFKSYVGGLLKDHNNMTTEDEIKARLLEIHHNIPLDKPWCEGYVTSLMDWDIIDEEMCDRLIEFIKGGD